MTLVSVPQLEPEQPPPDKDQVTPLFCASFCRTAENTDDKDVCTEAEGGFTVTEMGCEAEVMVMEEVAVLVLSALEVAVRVTRGGEGTADGAL